jgi:hypothetical protein
MQKILLHAPNSDCKIIPTTKELILKGTQKYKRAKNVINTTFLNPLGSAKIVYASWFLRKKR